MFVAFSTTSSNRPLAYCHRMRARHSATSLSLWTRPKINERQSMNRLLLLALLFLVAIPTVGWPHFAPATIPNKGVAYTSHGALIIKDAMGKTTRVIRTAIPIGSFSISPDRRSVVFAPPGQKCSAHRLGRQGGALYLLTLATGQTRRLIPTQTHIYDKRDVYADPDYSPNGSQIVFVIHRESCGDAVMTSGPYAVLDLRTAGVRVIASTLDPSGTGYGPAYGFNPRWSPNGQWILANFEDAFDLTTPSSKHLLGISTSKGWIPTPLSASGTAGVGWLGNGCVVFVATKGGQESAYVLNLSTHRTEPLAKLLGIPSGRTTDLVAFSPTIWVQRLGNELEAESPSGSWEISNVDQNTYVQVISPLAGKRAPLTCR